MEDDNNFVLSCEEGRVLTPKQFPSGRTIARGWWYTIIKHEGRVPAVISKTWIPNCGINCVQHFFTCIKGKSVMNIIQYSITCDINI